MLGFVAGYQTQSFRTTFYGWCAGCILASIVRSWLLVLRQASFCPFSILEEYVTLEYSHVLSPVCILPFDVDMRARLVVLQSVSSQIFRVHSRNILKARKEKKEGVQEALIWRLDYACCFFEYCLLPNSQRRISIPKSYLDFSKPTQQKISFRWHTECFTRPRGPE